MPESASYRLNGFQILLRTVGLQIGDIPHRANGPHNRSVGVPEGIVSDIERADLTADGSRVRRH